MKTESFILTWEDRDPPLRVLGTKVTVLASKAATRGYEITLQEGDEGQGPPPHAHDWDESFFVLEGKIEFTCGDRTQMCETGTLVHVPAGTVHAFTYGPGGGRMLEITGQRSLATQMFTALHNEIPQGPPDLSRIVEVLAKNGVTLPD